MKRYTYLLAAAAILASACSRTVTDNDDYAPVPIHGIIASMGERVSDEAVGSRAVAAGYAVNTAADTTHANVMLRTTWSLDLQIFKSGAEFDLGRGTFTWDQAASMWTYKGDFRYFPNYLKQNVKARLYPQNWIEVAAVQDTKAKLIEQDILVQNGQPYLQVAPAHIPTIALRHGNAMLDFVISGVTADQIGQLVVTAGGVRYTPLLLDAASVGGRTEYQLILPVGVKDPEIRLTTPAGATYIQTVTIAQTAVNTCYCFTLKGVELELTAITVSDWAIGEGLAGDYSAITTYPTFRGPENDYVTLFFDNGSDQRLDFSANGEATLKPAGRTIVRIQNSAGKSVILDGSVPDRKPIILRSMYVDLRPYINLIGTV